MEADSKFAPFELAEDIEFLRQLEEIES